MATSPTLDPYQVLGVEADADAAAIKKAYRKLVLTCHPDKVTDESLREQKQEEFHRIQQAYETIGEPDNREKYDAEVKLKKLKEERDRTLPKATPAQARRMNVNINIFSAGAPPEFRSSSSSAKSTPSKGSSSNFKQYSTDYSKSWEYNLASRPRGYEEERKTRRSASEEKLKRGRDDARRDQDRDRRKDEEEQRRRARAERDMKDRERERREEREARARRAEKDRKDQERRQQREELERIARHDRKARERERDLKRRQEEEEKVRAKNKAYVEEYSEDDESSRRNRSKKSSKRDSPTREKSSTKRSSHPDEAAREGPTVAKYSFTKAYAEDYIRRPQIKTSKSTSSRTDGPFSSPDYQNPFVPPRHVSGEAKLPKGDGIIRNETGTSSRSHSAMPSASPVLENPPRLRKAFTTTHVPSTDPLPQRAPLGRSQTMEPEYYNRPPGSERHRPSRERSSFDDENYYRPKLQKTYRVTHDTGSPRVSEPFYKDPYPPSPGSGFPKVKYAQAPEHISTSKRYDEGHYATSSYNSPSYTDYPTATFGQPYVATN